LGLFAFVFLMGKAFWMWEALEGKRTAEEEKIAERELLKGNC
jgi:hypothetical protein